MNKGTTIDDRANFEVTVSVKDVKTIIKEQPTVYNIDKIVEELELHSFELGTDTIPVHYVRLNEAIEIVKQGGDADDNCKWSQISTARYETSCGYKLVEFFDTNACYCKQCGKKIKIVGDWVDGWGKLLLLSLSRRYIWIFRLFRLYGMRRVSVLLCRWRLGGERMNKLNLETFNDILFGALKDQGVEGQIKMLKAELNMIGDMLFSETAELLDELEQCGYESERFTRIKNIKSNSEGLLLKLKGLEKELKEMESDWYDDLSARQKGEYNIWEYMIWKS